MEYRKNDRITVEIVDCGTDGEGIARLMASLFL